MNLLDELEQIIGRTEVIEVATPVEEPVVEQDNEVADEEAPVEEEAEAEETDEALLRVYEAALEAARALAAFTAALRPMIENEEVDGD